MKKTDFIYKTIQLVLYIVLTACCLGILLLDERVYHLVASDPSFRILGVLLWLALGFSFVFIYRDFQYFSNSRKDFWELDYAVHSDPLSGLANRFSCDVMIEKYLDKPIPENLGCIMFDLTNIHDTNKHYGHIQGNQLIRDFSNILHLASTNMCFVGRNGGNKFLALFEDGNSYQMDSFLKKLDQMVQSYNQDPANRLRIEYRCGTAFHEGEEVKTITDLIALSNRRIVRQDQREGQPI
ncbi:MAG: diguanylate cyclase [Lachnospiraceae bacterium]|nr:diguanylate cyclase [Lachnospiraceae bacterium]